MTGASIDFNATSAQNFQEKKQVEPFFALIICVKIVFFFLEIWERLKRLVILPPKKFPP